LVSSLLAVALDVALDADEANDFRGSVAVNTWKAYRSDLEDFDGWCRSKRRLWSTPKTVAEYFRALEEAGAAFATIERRKTAIAKLVEARRASVHIGSSAGFSHDCVAVSYQLRDRTVLAQLFSHADHQLLTNRGSELLQSFKRRLCPAPLHPSDRRLRRTHPFSQLGLGELTLGP